jgi:hypothetical protein
MSKTYVVVNKIVLVEVMDRNLLRTVENSRFAVEKVDRPVESGPHLTISPNVVFKITPKIFRFSLGFTGKFNKTSKIYSKNSQYQRPDGEQSEIRQAASGKRQWDQRSIPFCPQMLRHSCLSIVQLNY